MDSPTTKHHLHAVRMSWLGWIAQPVIAIWSFCVTSFMHTWSILKMSWCGMTASFNYRYWAVGTIGAAVSIFSYRFITYIGGHLYRNDVVDSMNLFEYVGMAVAALAVIWSIAEISKLIRFKQDNDKDIDHNDIVGQFGNGSKAISFMLSYVWVIIGMHLIQYVLDFTGLVPGIGPLFRGLISLPVFICSAVIIISAIIIAFVLPIVGPYVLDNENSSSFVDRSKKVLSILKGKWLDIVITMFPAIAVCFLALALPKLFTDQSTSLAESINRDVVEWWYAPGSEIETLEKEVSSLRKEYYNASYSEMEKIGENLEKKQDLLNEKRDELQESRAGYYNAFRRGEINFFGYIGEVLFMVTFAVVGGFVASFFISAFSSIYYKVYSNSDSGYNFFHKVFGVVIWGFIVGTMFTMLELDELIEELIELFM